MNLEFELTTAHIWILGGFAYFIAYCIFYRNLTESLILEKRKRKVTDDEYTGTFLLSLFWPIALLLMIIFYLPLIGVKDDD